MVGHGPRSSDITSKKISEMYVRRNSESISDAISKSTSTCTLRQLNNTEIWLGKLLSPPSPPPLPWPGMHAQKETEGKSQLLQIGSHTLKS